MSEWAVRRFWSAAHVVPDGPGFAVTLDARPLFTPAKAPLVLPTQAMAKAVAVEWDAQGERIDPLSMPVTRAANAAIDKITPHHADVADMIAAYGGTDLLCYRAAAPEGLVAAQAAAWDPLLDWAADALGARLVPTVGVMPVAQDGGALDTLSRRVRAMSPHELAGFHDLTMLSGSLIIAFAAIDGRGEPDALWAASRVDEAWQTQQWGRDDEAEVFAAGKAAAFRDAWRIHALARGVDVRCIRPWP